MNSLRYKRLFWSKIILGIVGFVSIVYSYTIPSPSQEASIVFIIDMQESMGTVDIHDAVGLVYSRQQAAMQYIYHSIQSMSDDVGIAMIRLGYYPDYILPLTHDRAYVASYTKSMAASPLAAYIVYQTGTTSLHDYYDMLPDASYVVISDKQEVLDRIGSYLPSYHKVHIGSDIASREDVLQNHIVPSNNRRHLGWIFVWIVVVSLLII